MKLAMKLVPANDAGDLTQEVMLELVCAERAAAAANLPVVSRFALARKICRNRAANLHRRNRRLLPCSPDAETVVDDHEAAEGSAPQVVARGVLIGSRQRAIGAIIMACGTVDDCIRALGLERGKVHEVIEAIWERCARDRRRKKDDGSDPR